MKKRNRSFILLRKLFYICIFFIGTMVIIASGGGGSVSNTISGTVWNDINRDGYRDSGEIGIENWQVFLDTNQNGFFDSGEDETATDQNGEYSFNNLKKGTYTVGIELDDGYTQTIPSESGSSVSARKSQVLGGEDAKSGDWPWMVALVKTESNNDYDGQFCGGTLIKKGWVLTAAHCFDDGMSPSDLEVVVGITELDSSGKGNRIRVQKIIEHPEYNSLAKSHDITLLRLGSPASSLPVPLLSKENENLSAPGTMATAIGWGNMSNIGSFYPTNLQQVQLPILSNSDVIQAQAALEPDDFDTMDEFDYFSNINLTNDMLFAGGYSDGGKDTCQGDSGGPLVVPNEQGNGWLLAGITSFGYSCGLPEWPGVYTRVSSYVNWINSTILNHYHTVELDGENGVTDIDFSIRMNY